VITAAMTFISTLTAIFMKPSGADAIGLRRRKMALKLVNAKI
jgi:hypothetical protein